MIKGGHVFKYPDEPCVLHYRRIGNHTYADGISVEDDGQEFIIYFDNHNTGMNYDDMSWQKHCDYSNVFGVRLPTIREMEVINKHRDFIDKQFRLNSGTGLYRSVGYWTCECPSNSRDSAYLYSLASGLFTSNKSSQYPALYVSDIYDRKI